MQEMQETEVQSLVGKIPWSRKWQPTPVFLSGKFHRQGSLVGYHPWGPKESDMTEHACHPSIQRQLTMDSYRWAAKQLSHTYTCVHSPQTPLPSRLPYKIEQSSLFYTVRPYWLSILNTAVCACPSQTPLLSVPCILFSWYP